MNTRKLNFRDYWIEFIVGLFFVLMIMILAYYTILLSKDGFSKDYYPVKVEFSDISGVEVGNKVLVRGMDVGTVKNLEMLPNCVLITLSVKNEIQLYKNCIVNVENSSILGGNLISITQGEENSGLVTTETILKGIPNKGMFGEINSAIAELRENGVFQKIGKISANLEEVTDKLNKGDGTLAKLLNDGSLFDDAKILISDLKNAGNSVEAAGKDVSSASNELKGMISSIRKDIDEAVKNVTNFTQKLNNDDSTIAKLFSDKGALYSDAEVLMKELREASEKLNNGDGALAKLLNDPTLYTDVKKTLGDVQAAFIELKGAMQDMREASTISTFGTFIFGAL